MANEKNDSTSIKVSAHVLVQLGEELVTDVEQAILECVKNAYDADSPGCLVRVDTTASGTISQTADADRLLRFDKAAENVVVTFTDSRNRVIRGTAHAEDQIRELDGKSVTRHVSWTGSITIEDTGDGLSAEQLRTSWLVISNSAKRADTGPKGKTTGGRTPLGDKGVGRLGSMKLGDVLHIESSQHPGSPFATAAFRWADCETATTVDEIPVFFEENKPNPKKFKGTRVSVFGIKDIARWKSADRALEISKSLARLISPFEAKSKFPVVVDVDGHRTSLVAVTDTLLSRAVADFTFDWKVLDGGEPELICRARFKERLFRPASGSDAAKEKVRLTFESDNGVGFLDALKTERRFGMYKITPRPSPDWFVEVEQRFSWSQIVPSTDLAIADPGALHGAFYYFNLQQLDPDEADLSERELGDSELEVVAGLGIDRDMVKHMSGVSILRDGFRVRSSGDWLGISQAMTSGGTYMLRLHNTIGFFALSGEHNFGLVEKSDREGFVENSAFRGFMAIAETCKMFANNSLDAVRRAQDRYAAKKRIDDTTAPPKTPERSLDVVENTVRFASNAKRDAQDVVESLSEGIAVFERQRNSGVGVDGAQEAIGRLRSALRTAKNVQQSLDAQPNASAAVHVIRQELSDNKERMLALYESAAVGLSARGLAHELRTHLVEIRKRTSSLEALVKTGKAVAENTMPHLRAIRISCGSIAAAASLIDPLLPRTRAVKESINLRSFVEQYVENRQQALDREDIVFQISPKSADTVVRINRGRLLQVLDNLVRNSVYWLKRGAAVMGVERAKKIRVTITSDGFEIADSGPGVDPSYEESIFEMFVTAKPAKERGQGLGLFIITQLLAADGCRVYLNPERNRDGKRFKFAVDLGAVVDKR
ncbi:sensor histidine kinase [Burkholderia vietnamiensis]|uniref:sensor histidine kinase n=1 Tax=Burkholderia vietnamiensis TaxID=60552 RepID=UPI0009BCCC4F|nr:sensor histidine kinase [Burkholderia vietnamiensis]